MSVRVSCNQCHSKSVINSSKSETPEFKTLYCSCTNPHCGHTFVSHLSFSHTLSPSAKCMPDTTLDKLHRMHSTQ